MMKQLLSKIIFVLTLLLSQQALADTGNLFEITGSGTPATLDIVLCLNGTGPVSCQNYTATRQTLSIRTVAPNHTYPAAGIKVLTPGFTLTGCTFIANGFCLFSVSNAAPAVVTVSNLAEPTLTTINPTEGPAAGGTGVTLTGTNLTNTTGITFDGVAATSVNVVNSTTVNAVTPAHAPGAVDVVITTPLGTATLTNGFTYEANEVGQSSSGGIIACLNGGLNNLIAATADNSTNIEWGGFGTAVGAGAQSDTDGANNTTAIVAALGNNGGTPYAAQLCNDFEVDSQGNTPCQAGNTCYDDWFLPAGNNLTPTGQLNCLFTNRAAIGGFANVIYWSSTEFSGDPTVGAWGQHFLDGSQGVGSKINLLRVRCVRAFTP